MLLFLFCFFGWGGTAEHESRPSVQWLNPTISTIQNLPRPNRSSYPSTNDSSVALWAWAPGLENLLGSQLAARNLSPPRRCPLQSTGTLPAARPPARVEKRDPETSKWFRRQHVSLGMNSNVIPSGKYCSEKDDLPTSYMAHPSHVSTTVA